MVQEAQELTEEQRRELQEKLKKFDVKVIGKILDKNQGVKYIREGVEKDIARGKNMSPKFNSANKAVEWLHSHGN